MKDCFANEHIINVLKEHKDVRSTTDIVRELGIIGQTFYIWKCKYGNMNVSEVIYFLFTENACRTVSLIVSMGSSGMNDLT